MDSRKLRKFSITKVLKEETSSQFKERFFRMKQSTISFGFILFSIVVLFTEVTSTISYGARVKQCAYDSSLGYDMDNGPTMVKNPSFS